MPTSTQASNSTKKILSALPHPTASNQEPGVLKNSHFTCAKSTGSWAQRAPDNKTTSTWKHCCCLTSFSVNFSFTRRAQWLDVLKSITLCPSPISRNFSIPWVWLSPNLAHKIGRKRTGSVLHWLAGSVRAQSSVVSRVGEPSFQLKFLLTAYWMCAAASS